MSAVSFTVCVALASETVGLGSLSTIVSVSLVDVPSVALVGVPKVTIERGVARLVLAVVEQRAGYRGRVVCPAGITSGLAVTPL